MRALIKDLSKCAFFLDYDGTLCPHTEVWEERVYNPQEIYSAVMQASRNVKSVMWNTGRRVESLAGVSENFLKFSGFFVQGSVLWDSSTGTQKTIGPKIPASLVGALQDLVQFEVQYRLEIKETGARLAPIRRTQRKNIRKFIEGLNFVLPDDWEWRIGDRGAELLHKGFSKGLAVAHAYENKLVPSDAIPVVAGDDLFDRSAMEFALARGGYAILLGDGCGWITQIPHRSSQVIFFREPKDFLQFLRNP